MPPVDRKKYAVDVLEHVLAGVRATSDETPETGHAEVVRLGVRPWLALGTMTGTSFTGNRLAESRLASGSGQGGDAYESDRRGEHHYHDDPERPSHRERRALKERLERER
jgi:hypothetical protein